MIFTDEDLERWREQFKKHHDGQGLALLDRLEAAEDAVQQAYRCTPENKEYYEKWLKAAGKIMACKKRWFNTEWRALAFRAKIRNELGKDQRPYYCKKCLGWHLTSRLFPWQIENARLMGYK